MGRGLKHVWGRGEVHTEILWGNPKERGLFEDLDRNGRRILRWIFRKWFGGMNWSHLAHDRGRWRALVNGVMNLRIA